MSFAPILMGISVILVIAGSIMYRKAISKLFVFENIYVFAAVVFSTVMCSGYMWNQIRTPPYQGRASPGKSAVIANGYQQQYGIETNIVAALYLIISSSFVGLSKVRQVPGMGKYVVFSILMAIFLFSYSVMFKVFKIKSGSYPFQLFL